MDYKDKYLKYKQKYLNYKNFLNNKQTGGSTQKPTLYLFKADWCGHCRSFKNEWERLQQMADLKDKVNFETVDADKNKEKINEWKVQGFPTLILQKDKTAIEYNQSRDAESLAEFIKTSL